MQMSNETNSNFINWSKLWWILSSVCIPLSLPWLIYQLLAFLKKKSLKAKMHGKVVLITGASSGLGKELAHSFYELGCQVIIASRRKEELLKVRDELIKSHETCPTYPPVVLPVDLSDINSLPKYIENALSIHGRIDILVNNAGISYRGLASSTNIDVDIKIMLVNYFGQIALTKALLPSMIERKKGHIVTISSVQGRMAIPGRSAYTASKHALQAFFDSLRAELSKDNIKVTVISPGYIQTNLSLNALTSKGDQYGVMDSTTAKGYHPKKVANEIILGVMDEKKEIVISPLHVKAAIILRTIAPDLYFWIMARRANK